MGNNCIAPNKDENPEMKELADLFNPNIRKASNSTQIKY